MLEQVESGLRSKFWTLPLVELNDAEWEALCDGCGRCCLHKLQDIDDDQLYYTDVACKLLNLETCRCDNYLERIKYVPDCMSIREEGQAVYELLPSSCAYRLRNQDKPLPLWHPLLTGSPDKMHALGVSVRGKAVSEETLDEQAIEERIIQWIG